MRINYLSASNLALGQANGVHVMHMCEAFTALGHETTLFCQGPVDVAEAFDRYGIDERFAVEGIAHRTMPLLGRAVYVLEMLRRARALPPPDLWYGRHVYAVAAIAWTDTRFILEQHAVHRRRSVRRLIQTLLDRPNLTAFVVISEGLKRACLDAYPSLDPAKIVVAHDGASPFPTTSPCLPKRQGTPDVGYAGHLYTGKGMEIIVPLATRLPDVRFHVVGGADRDVERWRAAGIPPNLILHGPVPHAHLPGYLASFDVALLPNQRRVALTGNTGDIVAWTSPLKMFEYMAAGLPIIASDLPVLREVLRHNVTALFAPPDDIDAWEQALRRLLDDEELRSAVGNAARAEFLSHYTWTARARHVLSATTG